MTSLLFADYETVLLESNLSPPQCDGDDDKEENNKAITEDQVNTYREVTKIFIPEDNLDDILECQITSITSAETEVR